MPQNTISRIGYRTFEALMHEALRCACDQHGTPLCVRCDCLFRLAVAATHYSYADTLRRRRRIEQKDAS